MAAQTYLEQITERVERLLLRHEELLRTNELLAEQLRQLGEERDGLRLKLQTALERIDAVLAQIPPATEAPLE
jgi:cell division septum initiation protein DivIVA